MKEKILTPAVLVPIIVALIAGVFAIAVIYIQEKIVRDNEAFNRAVAQLENPNIGVKRRGVSALRRLADVADVSEDLHWDIMETLTAYIRDNTKAKCNKEIGADIQEALTVIGQRSETHRKKEKEDDRSLDLRDSCLYRADLKGAHLEGAKFFGKNPWDDGFAPGLEGVDFIAADLRFADLRGVHMSNTDLRGAHLEDADLRGANLWDVADLRGAYLERADLRGAHVGLSKLRGAHMENADLTGANVRGSDLTDANLWNANLTGANMISTSLRRANLCGTKAGYAKNLRQKHLDYAFGDAATTLPGNLNRPSHWSKKVIDRNKLVSEWKKWKSEH